MNKYLENKWYSLLKKKYKLTDDDMEEYIESFKMINKGEIITCNILCNFLNEELDDKFNSVECKKMLIHINKKVRELNIILNPAELPNYKKYLDLQTYLMYIIPICQDYVINRISIKEFFDNIDQDQDGLITCNELISVLYKINRNFTPGEIHKYKMLIRQVCTKINTNKDGFMTYTEFKNFMISEGIILSNNFSKNTNT